MLNLFEFCRAWADYAKNSSDAVGKILQDIAYLLATAIGEAEYIIIHCWKEALQQVNSGED